MKRRLFFLCAYYFFFIYSSQSSVYCISGAHNTQKLEAKIGAHVVKWSLKLALSNGQRKSFQAANILGFFFFVYESFEIFASIMV